MSSSYYGGIAGELADEAALHPCAKPDCGRLVSAMSSFCCGPCAGANAGLYDLDPYRDGPGRDPYSMHTATCEGRRRARTQGAADARDAAGRALALGAGPVLSLADVDRDGADPDVIDAYLRGFGGSV